MLVLFETPAGYSIFRISSTKKLKSIDDIASMFKDEETASQQYETICLFVFSVELQCFKKFKDTNQAVASLTKVQEGELPDDLKKFLQKNIISKEVKENLLCMTIFLF